MKLESDFKKKVKKDLKKIPKCWFFINESALSIRGLPDIVGVINGRFFALELKRSGKELSHPRTVLQNYVKEKIESCGGIAEFTYPENWDEIFGKLASIQPVDNSL